MIRSIFVYNDYGVSESSVKHLYDCLKKVYENDSTRIEFINGKQIQEGKLFDDGDVKSKLVCLGGGFDLGYLQSLSDTGCEQIRQFVQTGGNYLGICAGAYFACDRIEFDLNGPLEVKGARRLKFFNGLAKGPINRLFKYNSDDFAKAIRVNLSDEMSRIAHKRDYYFYCNGGCMFVADEPDEPNFNVIARYSADSNDEQLITDCNDRLAIVECSVGSGKCLLSGVHFEFDAYGLDLSNTNIKLNLFEKLTQNEIDQDESHLHSNLNFTKILFEKVFIR